MFMPLALVLIATMFLGPVIQQYVTLAMFVMMLLMVIEGVYLGRMINKKVRARYPRFDRGRLRSRLVRVRPCLPDPQAAGAAAARQARRRGLTFPRSVVRRAPPRRHRERHFSGHRLLRSPGGSCAEVVEAQPGRTDPSGGGSVTTAYGFGHGRHGEHEDDDHGEFDHGPILRLRHL